MIEKNIYDYAAAQETAYQTLPITVMDGYEWQMWNHIRTTLFYKNSKYTSSGKPGDDRPFKNIIRPILNLQYRAEGFDVKDIVLFVNDQENYYKSFLVKKYHEKYARKAKIDTFIDELVETYCDYGGTLVKNVNQERPEVVPWQSIAFCDQTDLLSGPLAINHFYSPDELLDMASAHWGDAKHGANVTLDELITLAQQSKRDNSPTQKESKTPGKYINVKEIHGMFPNEWLENDESDEATESFTEAQTEQKYTRQLHIIASYNSEDGTKKGVTLFKGPEKDQIVKFIPRDKIYGRALGMGGAEELFEAQVWTNDGVQRVKGILDVASKMIFQTADSTFANRNKVSDLDNGEILIHADNQPIEQVNTQPVNVPMFDKAIADWESHAQQMGAANDTIMGEQPTSGTPFKLQELVTNEAHSLHEYRKGKLADFLAEIYRDWIIPYIVKEIEKGQEFFATLDLDELQSVADSLVTVETNKYIKQLILTGQEIQDAQVEAFKQKVRTQFMKGGNKRFLKILKGELKDAPIDIEVNIAGKQKDLAALTDKLVNIYRQILSNPTQLDDPRAAKIFNMILEAAGLDPIDFESKAPPQQQNSGPKESLGLSINFKDLPPDGQQQAAAQAGIKIAAAQPINQPTQ
jgi:hypothetical protein